MLLHVFLKPMPMSDLEPCCIVLSKMPGTTAIAAVLLAFIRLPVIARSGHITQKSGSCPTVEIVGIVTFLAHQSISDRIP